MVNARLNTASQSLRTYQYQAFFGTQKLYFTAFYDENFNPIYKGPGKILVYSEKNVKLLRVLRPDQSQGSPNRR